MSFIFFLKKVFRRGKKFKIHLLGVENLLLVNIFHHLNPPTKNIQSIIKAQKFSVNKHVVGSLLTLTYYLKLYDK